MLNKIVNILTGLITCFVLNNTSAESSVIDISESFIVTQHQLKELAYLQSGNLSLSNLVEKLLDRLSVDVKAQVDLIVVRSKQTAIPIARTRLKAATLKIEFDRSGDLSMKFPDLNGTMQTILQIELTSSRAFFLPYRLQSRVDPVLVRGENILISTCSSGNVHILPIVCFDSQIAQQKIQQNLEGFSQNDQPLVSRYLKALGSQSLPLSASN